MNYFLEQIYIIYNSYHIFFMVTLVFFLIYLESKVCDIIFAKYDKIFPGSPIYHWIDKKINTRRFKKLWKLYVKIILLKHKFDCREYKNIAHGKPESLFCTIKHWLQNKHLASKKGQIDSLADKYRKLYKLVKTDLPSSKDYLPPLQ